MSHVFFFEGRRDAARAAKLADLIGLAVRFGPAERPEAEDYARDW